MIKEKVKMTNLKVTDCTKEELLRVIDRLSMSDIGKNTLARALADIELSRENSKLNEADALAAKSKEYMRQYKELVSKYANASLNEIPRSAINEAHILLSKASEADRKWNKLMGLRADGTPANAGD